MISSRGINTICYPSTCFEKEDKIHFAERVPWAENAFRIVSITQNDITLAASQSPPRDTMRDPGRRPRFHPFRHEESYPVHPGAILNLRSIPRPRLHTLYHSCVTGRLQSQLVFKFSRVSPVPARPARCPYLAWTPARIGEHALPTHSLSIQLFAERALFAQIHDSLLAMTVLSTARKRFWLRFRSRAVRKWLILFSVQCSSLGQLSRSVS